jgi:hypothetical protein
MKNPSEHDEQVSLFNWMRRLENKYELLKFPFHVPNGGFRHISTAMRLKAEGVKPGVSDILILVPMHGFHGCIIEMKVGKNKPTPDQRQFLDDCHNFGYSDHVCYSWLEAARIICQYFDLPLDIVPED